MAALAWETVYIFISSTFNDMHAERDYLVKRVFPELAAWCEQRRLQLKEIDLRWGVTEEDSKHNRRTVEVCLSHIDKCRPFFVCLLGQRRGWIPRLEDIAPSTLERFPGLRDKLGYSMTELEVIHSLLEPLRGARLEEGMRALFYMRSPEYLESIHEDADRAIFTNAGDPDPAAQDAGMLSFRAKLAGDERFPCRDYAATWRPSETGGGIFHANQPALPQSGYLADFTCEGRTLHEVMAEDLKRAIIGRYGERAAVDAGPLQEELDSQACFLHFAQEAFIERDGDFDGIDGYLQSGETLPLLITARAGMGKTSLLAHYIQTCGRDVRYRFIGKAGGEDYAQTVARSILLELDGLGLLKSEVPAGADAIRVKFRELLGEAGAERPCVVVIDALDQLAGGAGSADFMLGALPPNVKLILSVKTEGSEAFIAQAEHGAKITGVRPFADKADRKRLVGAYLGSYLKKLDDDKLEILVSHPSADNPLYLKIVLNELRISGSHEGLETLITEEFGATPETAFDSVLRRLESDPPYETVEMDNLTQHVFGWLSHAQSGLEVSQIAQMLAQHGAAPDRETAADLVNLVFRQLRVYLAKRGSRTDFFYDSFKAACQKRYGGQAKRWHKDLALYFAGLPVTDRHRLMEQAYQYAMAGMTDPLMQYITGIEYVENRLKRFGAASLVNDCQLFACPTTKILTDFYRLGGHVLDADHEQLTPYLFAYLQNSHDLGCALLLSAAQARMRRLHKPWLKPKTVCFENIGEGSEGHFYSDTGLLYCLALVSGDTRFITVAGDRQMALWDIRENKIVQRIDNGQTVERLMASPDGSCVAAFVGMDTIRVWNMPGFDVRCSIDVGGNGTFMAGAGGMATVLMNKFIFTADSRAILMHATHQKTLNLYDAQSGALLLQTEYAQNAQALGMNAAGVTAAGNIHPDTSDPEYLFDGYVRKDNPIALYDYNFVTKTLQKRDLVLRGHTASVSCVDVSADGRTVASGDAEGQIRLWDSETGACTGELPGERYNVIFLRFLSGGKELLAADTSGKVAVYLTDGLQTAGCATGLGEIRSAALFGDESRLILRVGSGEVKVVNLRSMGISRSVSAPLRSIGVDREQGLVFASSYANYVETPYVRSVHTYTTGALYVISARDNSVIKQMSLYGCHNFDFVYLNPSGRFAVSKAMAEGYGLTVKCWEFDAQTMREDTSIGYEIIRFSGKMDRLENGSLDYNLSYDDQFITAYRSETTSVGVYKCINGRFYGDVKLQFLVGKNWAERSRNRPAAAANGQALYVLYPDALVLECYSLRDKGLLFQMELQCGGEGLYSGGARFENRVFTFSRDERELLYANEALIAVIDIAHSRVRFLLDRYAEGPDRKVTNADTFVRLSGDARLLAFSTAVIERPGAGGAYDLDFSGSYRVEVWDTRKHEKIAQFYTKGKTSSIVFLDDRTLMFGLENGKLCTLELQSE